MKLSEESAMQDDEETHMNAKTCLVFDIQRFSINDGPGIRTTVFLKGCPLRCIWCHNPESKSAKKQLLFRAEKCIGCLACAQVCEAGVHSFSEEGKHALNRAACVFCGKCAEECMGAIEICGREMTVSAVMNEVLKDRAFYRNSGGGMTVSGGEPLMHPELTLALLRAAKEEGLHTALETSGFGAWEAIEALAPYTDLFLWDVKETDEARHREYTGVSNARILENLFRLNLSGAQIVLRCPVIPGFNDRREHFEGISALAERLENVIRVEVEPYHPLGKSKSGLLGEAYPLEEMTFPEEETVQKWIACISQGTGKTVKKA